jgi:hypothetical protein
MIDDGCVKAVCPDEGDPDAVPGVAPKGDGEVDVPSFTLEVDGEHFVVRMVVDPATGYTDTGYTWLSGPNEGYGFGIGGPRTRHGRSTGKGSVSSSPWWTPPRAASRMTDV